MSERNRVALERLLFTVQEVVDEFGMPSDDDTVTSEDGFLVYRFQGQEADLLRRLNEEFREWQGAQIFGGPQ